MNKRLCALVAALLPICLLSACGSSQNGSAAGEGNSDDPVVLEAKATMEQAVSEKGFGSEPPPGPPAQTGKKVWLVTCGSTPGCTSVIDAAGEAAAELDWDVTEYDGQLQPSIWVTGLKQAVAAGADGIITQGIDCSLAKTGYKAAFDAGIPVIALATVDDCGEDGEPLVTLLPGTREFYAEQGRLQAQAAIAATNGTAQVIQQNEPDFTVTSVSDKAFSEEIARCTGCEVLEVQDITTPVYSNPANGVQIMRSLITKHPGATVIRFDNDSYLGLVATELRRIRSSHPDIHITGGEGSAQALGLIREGVVDEEFAASVGWRGWAGADSLNRLLSGVKPADLPDEGVSLVYVNAGTNMPEDGSANVEPNFDYRAAFKEIWAGDNQR